MRGVVTAPALGLVLAGCVDVAAGTVRARPGPALDGRRSFQTLSLLPGARALVAGGYDGAIAPTDRTWVFPVT